MDWFKSHWRALLQAGCAAAGAVSVFVPAVAPVAVVCAVAVPVVTQAKNWQDALGGIVDILKGTKK